MKPHQQSALHVPLYKIWVTWLSHLKPHQDSEFTWPGRFRGSSPITPNCSLLSSICNLVDAPQLLPERSWLGERERGGIPRMTDWENCSSDWVAGITCLGGGGVGGRRKWCQNPLNSLWKSWKQVQGQEYFYLFQPSDFSLETFISTSESVITSKCCPREM